MDKIFEMIRMFWTILLCCCCLRAARSRYNHERTVRISKHRIDEYTTIEDIRGNDNRFIISFIVSNHARREVNAMGGIYHRGTQKYYFRSSSSKFISKSTPREDIAPSIDLLFHTDDVSTIWVLKARNTGRIIRYLNLTAIPGTVRQMKLKIMVAPGKIKTQTFFPRDCGHKKIKEPISINLNQLCNTTKNGPIPKIVGGQNAPPGHFPWQVWITDYFGANEWRYRCGGTLISSCAVLTAGHCISTFTASHYRVTVGDYYRAQFRDGSLSEIENARNFSVTKVIVHEKYERKGGYPKYDITLLALSKNSRGECVTFGTFAQPACLPTLSATPEAPHTYVISGWGARFFGQGSDEFVPCLQKAEVQKYTDLACKRNYETGVYNASNMICALGIGAVRADTCQGDSGGPLASENSDSQTTVQGITSFGEGCGGTAPGIYTKVEFYLDWIINKFLYIPELRTGE